MKRMYFLLLPLLLFGSNIDSNNNSVEIDERVLRYDDGRVIKILFDNVESKELEKEKFGVVIYHPGLARLTVRELYFLAWFTYSCDGQYIIVNYFPFPVYENFNDQVIDRKSDNQIYRQFSNFLLQIIENKKIANMEDAKQLRILIPIGLQNDNLFNKMRKIDPYKHKLSKESIEEWAKIGVTEKDIYTVSFGNKDIYYWGFKSNEIEYIRDDDSYHGNFMIQICREILAPIETAISEHETPEGWEDDYKKYREEQNRKYMETLNKQNKQSNGN